MLQRVKRLMAMLLVLVMCLSFAAPALAAGPVTRDTAAPTDKAAITKKLVVPYGTTMPEITFTFTVTPIDKDGAVFTPATPNVPVVGDPVNAAGGTDPVAGTFDAEFSTPGKLLPVKAPTGSPVPSPVTENPDVDGNCTYFIQTDNIFKDVDWDLYGAGIYKYTIEETDNDWTQTTTGSFRDFLTLDTTLYTMLVYVARDATGECSITNIGVVVVTPGGTIDDKTPKIDPTPDGGDSTEYFTSQMIFTNKYWKRVIRDPAAGGMLNVSKKTIGDLSDDQLYFQYSMTLNKPDLAGSSTMTTRAYIYEYDTTTSAWEAVDGGDMQDPDKNNVPVEGTIDGTYNASYFTVTYGTAFTFALKHNQRLVFADVATGSTYTVTETGVPGYFPNAKVDFNGGTPPSGTNTPERWTVESHLTGTSNKGDSLTIPSSFLLGVGTAPGKLYVGDTAPNAAAFTNDRGEINVIGVDINDMPFVGLIALALVGIAAFVVVSRRRKARHSEN